MSFFFFFCKTRFLEDIHDLELGDLLPNFFFSFLFFLLLCFVASHSGFETISYVLEGSMEHKDSQGNSGKLHKGAVQWMTAGGNSLAYYRI